MAAPAFISNSSHLFQTFSKVFQPIGSLVAVSERKKCWQFKIRVKQNFVYFFALTVLTAEVKKEVRHVKTGLMYTSSFILL